MFLRLDNKTCLMGLFTLLLTIVLIIHSILYALTSDQKEKMYISADSLTYQHKANTQLFKGHVHAKQGTTYLNADWVMVYLDEQHNITKIMACGDQQPALYWTLLKPNAPTLYAQAQMIQYNFMNQQMILTRHAIVTQGHNMLKGQKIMYNNANGIVTVPPQKNGRATLTYQ